MRYIVFLLFVLPKFIVWPLYFLYRLYIKKRGIENDFVTRAIKYLKCFFMQKFRGRGYLYLIKENMETEFPQIKENLLSLLSREYSKSTLQLTEEFRAEYPGAWGLIMDKGKEAFGESCTMILSPTIFLGQLLHELDRDKKVTKVTEQRETKWKIRTL